MARGVIENLIEQLTKLPGVGRKSAQRLAFFILNMKDEDALALAGAITALKQGFLGRLQTFKHIQPI